MEAAVAGLADAVLGVVRDVGLSDDVVARYGRCCGIVEFFGQQGIDVLSRSVVEEFVACQRERAQRGEIGRNRRNALVKTARQALWDSHDSEADQVFIGGAARMASTFQAVDTVRQVLAGLEQQYVLVSLLREALDQEGLTVAIGAEHGVDSLAECSIVVAPYEVDGAHGGTIGVLGPTRMNYPQAMAAVAIVSARLGRHLREG